MARSPWSTWTSTLVWPSAAVVKISLFRVGIVVFRSISFVKMPPFVSTPRLRGVTSSRRMSFTSPLRTAAWIAAPSATHCIGSTVRSAGRPRIFSKRDWTAGIRVGPPTRITWFTSRYCHPPSLNAWRIGPSRRFSTGSMSCSSFARVTFFSRCTGCPDFWAMKGKLIVVSVALVNSILAFLVEAVGQGGRGRLVNLTQDVEARDLARILRGLPLIVVEVRRHSDRGLVDRLAGERFRVRLDLPEDHRRDLLGRVILPVDPDLVVGPHLPLDLHDRPIRIQDRLALRWFPDENPVLREGHDGGKHLPAVRASFGARDDPWRSPFHGRGLGIGRAEV